MWYIHMIKSYLVIKRNEALIHTTIWMNLEHILNESSSSHIHTLKKKHLLYSYEMSRIGKF